MEAEAVAVVAFAHGIVEATRGAHDRHTAVTKRDHLPQSTRLEARGHEERVAARVEALRQRGVEPDAHGDPVRMRARMLLHHELQMRIARPEQHQLRIGVLQQPRHGLIEQVEPFLLHQPGHDAQQRAIGHHRKAELRL